MLVALLSDIHDHDTHLLLALHAAKEQGCTHLLFMGDMTGMHTFRLLREEWAHPIDLVFGNNEFETGAFTKAAMLWKNTILHGDHASISLDGRNIFFCHFPWIALKAAESGRYDAVFFGHTHAAEIITTGKTTIANPGEVYGRRSTPSIGIYDTKDNSVRIINL